MSKTTQSKRDSVFGEESIHEDDPLAEGAHTAEFVIHKVFDRRPRLQGHEVARVTVSTNKWGPANAIEKFVRENKPPAGK